MDIVMGAAVVLIGAAALIVVCAVLWGTIRALGDGKFGLAALLIAGLVVAGYYGKQGYAVAADHFAATRYTLDLRSPLHVNPAEWNGDVRRTTGPHLAVITLPSGRAIQMSTTTIELRKRDADTADSIWLCSDHLTSDDAADLIREIAAQLDVKVDTLNSWADARRHTFARDAQGWTFENGNRRPYVKLNIDSDGQGYWWASVLYAK